MTTSPESSPEREAIPDEGVDTRPLERSQEKIDEAQGAVQEAMSHSAPADDLELPGTGKAADSGEDEEVTARPN